MHRERATLKCNTESKIHSYNSRYWFKTIVGHSDWTTSDNDWVHTNSLPHVQLYYLANQCFVQMGNYINNYYSHLFMAHLPLRVKREHFHKIWSKCFRNLEETLPTCILMYLASLNHTIMWLKSGHYLIFYLNCYFMSTHLIPEYIQETKIVK